MLIDMKFIYRVSCRRPTETVHYRLQGLRYGVETVDVPEADDVVAPPSFVATTPDGDRVVREEFKNVNGVLCRPTARIWDIGGRPQWLSNRSDLSREEIDFALPENAEDIASGEEREKMIEAGRRRLAAAMVERTDSGLRLIEPVPDPVFLVYPPGRDRKSPSVSQVSMEHAGLHCHEFREALRDDRVFGVDELDEAMARGREFGPRVWRDRTRYELKDTSCLSDDWSTQALRLAGAEALDAVRGLDQPDLNAAGLALEAVLHDPGANAAAICPAARYFMATFAASPELLAASRGPEIGPPLERLGRAETRARKRMAASRIPDHDPRALAGEDELALAGMGM